MMAHPISQKVDFQWILRRLQYVWAEVLTDARKTHRI